MAFYKQSDSNLENNDIHVIREVVNFKNCETCGKEISPLNSVGGEIVCPHCNNKNSIMENNQ